MLRKIIIIGIALVLLAPFGTTSALVVDDEPELKLNAPPPRLLRPRMPNQRGRTGVSVRVTAQLENLEDAENLEDYYCLEQVWEWDDDTESEYAPDCDPYEEGMEIQTRFSATHEYRYPGSYTVWLRLQYNGETVISGNTRVMIRG